MEKFFRLLKITAEVILILGFIFFEEIMWKLIALPIKNWIVKREILQSTKEKIMEQSPYATLAIFTIPLFIAEGMGFYSGYLFVSGSVMTGLFVYALKAPIAGITFWIFSFSKEKLLTIDWFETLFDLLMRFINFIKDTQIYKDVKLKIVNMKDSLKKSIKKMMPGGGGLSKEVAHVYSGLKNIFKGAKAIDDEVISTENTEVKDEGITEPEKTKADKPKTTTTKKATATKPKTTKIKKEEPMEKEDTFVDPVERIAEANKHKEIKPSESRRDKNPPKKEEEYMGSVKR